jgi:hypothetical protein
LRHTKTIFYDTAIKSLQNKRASNRDHLAHCIGISHATSWMSVITWAGLEALAFSGSMAYFTQMEKLPWIVGFAVILLQFFGALFILFGFMGRFFAFRYDHALHRHGGY